MDVACGLRHFNRDGGKRNSTWTWSSHTDSEPTKRAHVTPARHHLSCQLAWRREDRKPFTITEHPEREAL